MSKEKEGWMIDARMKQDIAKGESGRVQINMQAKEGAE